MLAATCFFWPFHAVRTHCLPCLGEECGPADTLLYCLCGLETRRMNLSRVLQVRLGLPLCFSACPARNAGCLLSPVMRFQRSRHAQPHAQKVPDASSALVQRQWCRCASLCDTWRCAAGSACGIMTQASATHRCMQHMCNSPSSTGSSWQTTMVICASMSRRVCTRRGRAVALHALIR